MMEIIKGSEELQEDEVMLALINRQTPEGSSAAQMATEQRIQASVEEGLIDPQRLALYGRGLVALTGEESDVLWQARYPGGIMN